MGLGSDVGGLFETMGVSGDLFGGAGGGFIMNFIVFVVFLAILGVGVYFISQKKLYSEKIQIFEEINGQSIPTKAYMAKEVNIPNTSIKVFQIKGNNMFLPRPTIQTGVKNWLFFIRDDHEWVNVGITSLNKQLTEMGLKYNHVDMRYANASLKELIKSNYGQENFWTKYGAYVALGFLVIMMCIGFYLVAEKLAEVSGTLVDSVTANNALMEKLAGNFETSGITKLN